MQLVGKAITVKTGTLVDATVIGSASYHDQEAAWSSHRTRQAAHRYDAQPVPTPIPRWSSKSQLRRAISTAAEPGAVLAR
ncbi:MAG: hypothetical protein M3N26_11440 [Pseudomonadota bacterium]|nr:hypothetical protein [Pseudomonadota bacterium]